MPGKGVRDVALGGCGNQQINVDAFAGEQGLFEMAVDGAVS